MITALDDQIGRIVAELDKKGLRDNTIILFASDNGGATSGLFAQGAKSNEERKSEEGGIEQGAKAPASNAPFRGGKGGIHEGGVRVPAFVNWPAKLKPRVVDAPLHMVDVMPTLLALPARRAARPSVRRQGHVEDHRRRAPSPNEDVLIDVEAFRGAIRKGDWKLVKIALLPGKTELFNLARDPARRPMSPNRTPMSRVISKRVCWPMRSSRSRASGSRRNPAFAGAQGKTVFDPDFDIDDGGLPHEKSLLPKR